MGSIAILQVDAKAHTKAAFMKIELFLIYLFFSSSFVMNELKKLSPKRAKEADLKAVKKP